MTVKVNIISTWCILVTKTVTFKYDCYCLTGRFSDMAGDGKTDTRAHIDTHRHGRGSTLKSAKSLTICTEEEEEEEEEMNKKK